MKLSLLLRGNIESAMNLKIRYRHKNVLVLINTDIVVNKKDFQEVRGKWVKPTAANHVTTNINIQKAWSTVEDFCNKYYYENAAWPEAELVKKFSEKSSSQLAVNTNSFDKLTREFLNHLTHRDAESISMGTSRTYTSVFAKVKKFITSPEYSTYGDAEGNIFLDKIDKNFYYNLKTYLRKEFDNGDNTIHLAITRFNSLVYWAIKMGYTSLTRSVIEGSAPGIKERDIIFYTDEEMRLLFNVELSGAYDRFRDVACLQAVLGFRFSDTDQSRWRLNLAEATIEFLSQKTGNYISMWLPPEAIHLIRKYHDKGKPFPKSSKVSDYDIAIKEIAKKAGITTPVTIIKGRKQFKSGETVEKWQLTSSHVFRATFICSVINRGVPPAIAAEMAGINISTLDYYAKVMDSTKRKAAEMVYSSRGDLRVVHVNEEKAA